MSGGGAGHQLDWACQGTCACEPWGRETPQRTAPGEVLGSRHRTRVRFPPPPRAARRRRSCTDPVCRVDTSRCAGHPASALATLGSKVGPVALGLGEVLGRALRARAWRRRRWCANTPGDDVKGAFSPRVRPARHRSEQRCRQAPDLTRTRTAILAPPHDLGHDATLTPPRGHGDPSRRVRCSRCAQGRGPPPPARSPCPSAATTPGSA